MTNVTPRLQVAVTRARAVFEGAELGDSLGRCGCCLLPEEEAQMLELGPDRWTPEHYWLLEGSVEEARLSGSQVKALLPAAFQLLAAGEDLSTGDRSLWFLAQQPWREWPAEESDAVRGFCDAWLDAGLAWQIDDPLVGLNLILVTLATLRIDTVMRMREGVSSGDPKRLAFLVPLCAGLSGRQMCQFSWRDQADAGRSIAEFIYGPEVSQALERAISSSETGAELASVLRELRAYLVNEIAEPFDRYDTYDWSEET